MNKINHRYNKFDASYKLAMIDEYLNRSECSASQFAVDHGIGKSTFHKWLKIYRDNEINEVKTSSSKPNKFIQLSTTNTPMVNDATAFYSEPVSMNSNAVNNNTMKLNYKGAILEFDSKNLHQIMNELKQW